MRTKLAEVIVRLTHVHVKGEPKSKIEEMLEDYVMQCDKAMQTGKRDDLPKYLQTKLNAQKRQGKRKLGRRLAVQQKRGKQ